MNTEPELPGIPEKPRNLRDELETLLNSFSAENGSNTPDFILAQYVGDSLHAFDAAVNAREVWYGRKRDPYELANAGIEPRSLLRPATSPSGGSHQIGDRGRFMPPVDRAAHD